MSVVAFDCRSTYARSSLRRRVFMGTCTAPILAQANMAWIHSGELTSQMATFSPGPTPSWIRPLAARSMSAASWRNETRCPWKVSASRSPQRAAACTGRSPSRRVMSSQRPRCGVVRCRRDDNRSDAPGHVDGHAGDEIRVRRGEETDHARLIHRLGHAAEWRVGDLLRLLIGSPPLPVGPDTLGQGEARRDGIDVHAEGTELVAQLAGEGDDAALGRR